MTVDYNDFQSKFFRNKETIAKCCRSHSGTLGHRRLQPVRQTACLSCGADFRVPASPTLCLCSMVPFNSALETNCLSPHQQPSRRISFLAPLPVVDRTTFFFVKIEPSIKAASPPPLGLKPALKRINYSHLPKSAL